MFLEAHYDYNLLPWPGQYGCVCTCVWVNVGMSACVVWCVCV